MNGYSAWLGRPIPAVNKNRADKCDKLTTVQQLPISLPHLHSTSPLRGEGGPRRNVAMAFDTEKLEWCGYPMVKNFEDKFIRFDRIH